MAARKRPLAIRVRGHIFVFAYDDVDPELLHIYARHLMEPSDAIRVFFNGTATWNDEHSRWESEADGKRLYWFWRNEQAKIVGIISCFRR